MAQTGHRAIPEGGAGEGVAELRPGKRHVPKACGGAWIPAGHDDVCAVGEAEAVGSDEVHTVHRMVDEAGPGKLAGAVGRAIQQRDGNGTQHQPAEPVHGIAGGVYQDGHLQRVSKAEHQDSGACDHLQVETAGCDREDRKGRV